MSCQYISAQYMRPVHRIAAMIAGMIGLVCALTLGALGARALDLSQVNPQWSIETIDANSRVSYYVSLVMDAADYPHISYYVDNPTPAGIKYAFQDNGGWHYEPVSAGGVYNSMALDNNGNPHISFSGNNPTSDGILRYALRDSSGWHTEIAADLGWAHIQMSSIGVDDDGGVHISFYNNYPAYDIMYGYKDQTGWRLETIADLQYALDGYNSLALDAAGHPHVSYPDVIGGQPALVYAHRDTSGWHSEVVSTALSFAGYYNSITIDSDGFPHIAFGSVEPPGPWTLHYAYKDGQEWHTEAVEHAYIARTTSIRLDSENVPHVAYLDQARNELMYAKRSTSSWEITSLDSVDYAGNWHTCSLAVDSEDSPRVTYIGNNWRLRYGRYLSHKRFFPVAQKHTATGSRY